MRLQPTTLAEANRFVAAHHRHHRPTQGHKFSVALAEQNEIIGLAIAGRPVSRMLDDGKTIEITRLCTTGHRNAASMLYAAITRAAKALGHQRAITYTLATERGTSLRAAGFTATAQTRAEHWTRPSRPRQATTPATTKIRWERNPQ